MANDLTQTIDTFLGIKNDDDPKLTPMDYMIQITNWNYPIKGIKGLSKILFPSQINQIGSAKIYGLFEYKYLNQSNVLVTEEIGVTNGAIYKTVLGSEIVLKSGLTVGKCTFVIFQDNLFICNGKNYPQVYYGTLGLVSEMGAPAAILQTAVGNIDSGTHYYAMTYVTAGGEEVIGSISNTITTSIGHAQAILNIPIGYAGTISRRIYRTEAGGTTLKFLYAVPDNTTLTYTDNTADGSLTTAIPATNNELPKPYFITVANQKIYATKCDKYPTQVFITDTNLQVLDFANGLDVANYGDDNTPIAGMALDYDKVVVGTGKHFIFLDPINGEVIRTRANVGIKDGYSMQLCSAFGQFPGGLMFVSTMNDVRLLTGTQAAAVFQTLDNIKTDSWSQSIRGDLDHALESYTNISSAFYDNRYHLVIDGVKYVFDIRTKGWTEHNIITASYSSQPIVLAVLNGLLYNGQSNGWIELEYADIQYKGEDVPATLLTPYIQADSIYKWVKKFFVWITASEDSVIDISVTLDSNTGFTISGTATFLGGVFDSTVFDPNVFAVDNSEMDYKVFNINAPCRWIQMQLICTSGNISLQKLGITGTPLLNKEKRLIA